MISICHPEEPAFGSEGSGCAARTFARFSCEGEIARTARIRKGGESEKFGQFWAIRAVCRSVGSDSHRLHDFSSSLPSKLTALTTFYHFVPHLTVKSFIVKKELEGRSPTSALIRENTKACG